MKIVLPVSQAFRPITPSPGGVAMTKTMTKRDQGAVLFQSYFNQLREDSDRMDANQLKVMRILGEMKRRLDVLEESVRLHREVIFEQEPVVKMSCISCDHSFTLPLPEARVQNFTSACPQCHNWALPSLQNGREYSLREIAQMTGFAYETTCQAVREMELRPRLKKGKQHKPFTEREFKKIETVLQEKTPRRGENGRQIKNQG